MAVNAKYRDVLHLTLKNTCYMQANCSRVANQPTYMYISAPESRSPLNLGVDWRGVSWIWDHGSLPHTARWTRISWMFLSCVRELSGDGARDDDSIGDDDGYRHDRT